MTAFSTMPLDPWHHNAPWHLSSQCSMKHFLTMLQYAFHPNFLWPLSSQFSMTPVIVIVHDPFHLNAPGHLSSQCSMAFVISMLHGPWIHSAPWPVSSQCSMTSLSFPIYPCLLLHLLWEIPIFNLSAGSSGEGMCKANMKDLCAFVAPLPPPYFSSFLSFSFPSLAFPHSPCSCQRLLSARSPVK